jgi:hypothetical protein
MFICLMRMMVTRVHPTNKLCDDSSAWQGIGENGKIEEK